MKEKISVGHSVTSRSAESERRGEENGSARQDALVLTEGLKSTLANQILCTVVERVEGISSEAVSWHDNNGADRASLQWQQPGSLHWLSSNARGAIIGNTLATNIPEATKEEESRTESALPKRLWGEARSPSPI